MIHIGNSSGMIALDPCIFMRKWEAVSRLKTDPFIIFRVQVWDTSCHTFPISCFDLDIFGFYNQQDLGQHP
jgi:hypothetical protein